jgi:hypothetical protein
LVVANSASACPTSLRRTRLRGACALRVDAANDSKRKCGNLDSFNWLVKLRARRPSSHFKHTRTRSGIAPHTSLPATATTRGRSKTISATRTSGTRYGTRSYRRRGSRISGGTNVGLHHRCRRGHPAPADSPSILARVGACLGTGNKRCHADSAAVSGTSCGRGLDCAVPRAYVTWRTGQKIPRLPAIGRASLPYST